MIRMLLLSLLALPADPIPQLSVCDAVAKRAEYAGQMVAIRGQVAAGGHGPYMVAASTCSYELVTKGVVWPNIINLVYPNNRSRDTALHAPFLLDAKAIRQADEYLRKEDYRPDVDVEFATYVGLLATFSDLDNRVSPGIPGALRLGFGPAGMGAPVQLVIKTIEDVSIIKGGVKLHHQRWPIVFATQVRTLHRSNCPCS